MKNCCCFIFFLMLSSYNLKSLGQACTNTYYNYSDTICEGNAILFAGQIISNASQGVYIDTIHKQGGCDSIIILRVICKTVVIPTITRLSPDSLFVTGIDKIQWVNCTTGEILYGDTFPLLVVTEYGEYNVSAPTNNCGALWFCIAAGYSSVAHLNNNSVKLFPNPTTASFTLQLASSPTTETYFILYDAMGREVKREEINSNITTINRNNLPGGIYIWQLESANKILDRGKLVME